MSSYVKHVGLIHITYLDHDMNIDCQADKIQIDNWEIESLNYFSLGTKMFYDSVTTAKISPYYEFQI